MTWTLHRLGSDFSTTDNATPQATGLKFTPAASKRYWVKGTLILSSDTLNVAFNPGLSWPGAGIDYSVASVYASQTRDGSDPSAVQFGPAATAVTAGTDLGLETPTWFGMIDAIIETDGAPSGDVEVMLKVEAAGAATVKLHEHSTLWVWEY